MNKCLSSGLMVAALLIATSSVPAISASVTETFDASPSGWTVDRYAPAGFTSPVLFDGDNRLQQTISVAGGLNNRPSSYQTSFYNTQGMGRSTPAGTIYQSVDMYVSSAMLADQNRVAGLWGVGYDATSVISLYPVLELSKGQFQGWNDAAGWVSMGALAGLTGDQWVTLAMVLNTIADTVTYTVNGQLATTVSAFGTQSIGGTILQVYNTAAGLDRSVYWDNLTTSDVMPTPLPGALVLFGSILGLGALVTRRRRPTVVA